MPGRSADTSAALAGSTRKLPPSMRKSGAPSGSPWRSACPDGSTGTQAMPGRLAMSKAGATGSSTKSPASSRTGSPAANVSQQPPSTTIAKPGMP
ncbi:hypothetical protein BHE75_00779 [Sphingomonas haloaromaticamans]|uniref:Uncharacterized protein n=1 Tax=Edaphosphingomonas haloaromaticamans TaxID=653954 RepID=A0A1S1HAC6_9SPHN|nr:hypothetical protein BHE75_00779 [Sphingomonas haloaromaticamans]